MLTEYISPDFVDTYEAFSEKAYVGGNNIAISYVNIGLMSNNPIKGGKSVVDYSYYLLVGVGSVTFNFNTGNLKLNFDSFEKDPRYTEYLIIGGYNGKRGIETKIECDNSVFIVPDYAKF